MLFLIIGRLMVCRKRFAAGKISSVFLDSPFETVCSLFVIEIK